jgi:hypothetical protein
LVDREWSLQAAWVTAYLEDHPPDASSEIRAEQTGVSRFVCQATDGRKPAVNRARRKLT